MLTREQIIHHLDANQYLSQDDRRQILGWLKGREVPKEEWKDIPGYKSIYQASNFGWIKRINAYQDKYEGLIMKQYPDKDGYLRISLSKNSKKSTHIVHRLISETFIPNPENRPQINHKLGIKAFNWVVNLEWATNQENRTHAVKNGLEHEGVKGEANPLSKLTNKDVIEIRKRYKNENISYKKLAEDYPVNHVHIFRIVKKKRWAHV